MRPRRSPSPPSPPSSPDGPEAPAPRRPRASASRTDDAKHATATLGAKGRETLALVLGEHARFAAFLRRRLRDEAAAEDVLQAAYASVLARDAGPRDRTRVVAWFFRVLRRALVDHLRHQGAGRRSLTGRAATVRLTEADEAELRSTVCACVSALLPSLRPEYADVLRRVELDGDSVADAARTLGITAGNAAVRVHRARAALAAQVRSVCGACTAHGCLRCTCAGGAASKRV